MIKKLFDVPIYEWNITMLEIESVEDIPELNKWCELFETQFQNDASSIVTNNKDTGVTYIDHTAQKALIIILPSTSKEQRISTICHEKRHLEDFILEDTGVNDKEAAGYLAGYLSKYMIYDNQS